MNFSQDELRSALLRLQGQISELDNEIDKLENKLTSKKSLVTSLSIVSKMFDELLTQNPPV